MLICLIDKLANLSRQLTDFESAGEYGSGVSCKFLHRGTLALVKFFKKFDFQPKYGIPFFLQGKRNWGLAIFRKSVGGINIIR